ncbi:MAG: hypothetical protein IIB10_12455 [Chloroflexi bacterium]|nr:hypothetical protein [Chloroflexota bacterium]
MTDSSSSTGSHTLMSLMSVLLLVLLYLGGEDVFEIAIGNARYMGGESLLWLAGSVGYVAAALVVAGLCIWAITSPETLISWYDRSLAPRIEKLGWARWAIAGLAILFPSILFLGIWGKSLTAASVRILILFLSAVAAGLVVSEKSARAFPNIALSLLLGASVFGVSKRLILVTDYPFKLYWSEGNRLWDYSLYFLRGQYLVEGDFTFPTYLTPGRHGLWGLPFLIPGATIATLRLWDVVLWTLPYLLLGWLFFTAKRTNLSWRLRFGIALWMLVYLTLAGTFAPLVLSAILLAWLLNSSRPLRAALLAAAAGFYAGISRWTWFAAPAVWAGLWILLDVDTEPHRKRRFVRSLGVGAAGLFGGIAAQALMSVAFPRPEAVFSTAFSQPLLWYRLLPNALSQQGILRSLLIAIGPLVVLLIWGGLQGRPRWGWLEWSALWLSLAGFLGLGIAASVKIGGGNNLHNLDMFMMTLLFALAWVAIRWLRREGRKWSSFPGGIQALLVLAILIPSFDVMRSGRPTRLPDENAVQESLEIIRAEAARADVVLFIDQRQLLTFGQVGDEPLILDYELKHMMNQAMSSNQEYFDQFEDDLAAQRFDLIVSDALPGFLRGSDYQFGEENDVWLKFGAGLLNKYYVPIRKLPTGIWLLAPSPRR